MSKKTIEIAIAVIGIAIAIIALIPQFGIWLEGAPQSTHEYRIERRLKVPANVKWQDTGIDIDLGDTILITYVTGKWSIFDDWAYFGPEGAISEYSCMIMPQENVAALIAKVGNNSPFYVGNHIKILSKYAGNLFLSINDCDEFRDNNGSLTLDIAVGQLRQ